MERQVSQQNNDLILPEAIGQDLANERVVVLPKKTAPIGVIKDGIEQEADMLHPRKVGIVIWDRVIRPITTEIPGIGPPP